MVCKDPKFLVVGLKVTRVLHAGYIFEDQSSKIIFDPIFETPFSVNCYAYPNIEFDVNKIKQLEFSAVFISHFHDDHCSFDSLNLLKRSTPIYIYCLNEEMLQLIRELGFKNVYPLKINHEVKIGTFKVTPHRALEEEVDCVFQISTDTINVLNVVDSWIDYDKVSELAKIKWNLILWPFQTMRELEVLSPHRSDRNAVEVPFEWVEQLQALNPQNLVPSSCQFINESWSWYNHAFYPISYKMFIEKMQKSLKATSVFRINSGATLKLSVNAIRWVNSVDWIKPIGPQDLDYCYLPSQTIPSLLEVSKKFNNLSTEQQLQIKEFCKVELLNKLNNLDFSNEDYFQFENFTWCLKVYSHHNSRAQVDTYTYAKVGKQFKLLQNNEQQAEIHWQTEIAEFKLWNALFQAEAMTSLYLRINDGQFSAENEKLLKEISLIEDPLIRVLYNNNFASYQKKQLERIRTTVKF